MSSESKQATVIDSGEGRRLNVLGHAVTVRLPSVDTHGDSYVFEVITPPGLAVPPHVHEYEDEYVACLFLRFERGEIAWATFLNASGVFTDRQNGHRDCGYFYDRLNALEGKEYSPDVEQHQRREIEQEYAKAIAATREIYEIFLEYFRRCVAKEA